MIAHSLILLHSLSYQCVGNPFCTSPGRAEGRAYLAFGSYRNRVNVHCARANAFEQETVQLLIVVGEKQVLAAGLNLKHIRVVRIMTSKREHNDAIRDPITQRDALASSKLNRYLVP